jgi:hypothetical protein
MQPILASDFGNAVVLILAVPALGLAMLVGILCFIFRLHTIAVICGIVCLFAAAWLLWSSMGAKNSDGMFRNALVLVLCFQDLH